MKYNKEYYNMLRKGIPLTEGCSFSKSMREDMQNNRMRMFTDVIDYLEENNIEYEQVSGTSDIRIKDDVTLSTNMRVVFSISRKSYQYNYEKIIRRFIK